MLKGNIPAEDLYSNKKFVEPMLDYIVEDYQNSKIAYNDDTIGAMVILILINKLNKSLTYLIKNI